MKDDNGGDLRIGYGRPPRHTQFKKGRSGNPGGRPKGDLSLRRAVTEALSEPVTIEVQGKKKRYELGEVIARNLATTAAKGDVKAIALIDKMQSRNATHLPVQQATDQAPIRFTLSLEEEPPRPPDFAEIVRICTIIRPDDVTEEAKALLPQALRLKELFERGEHLKPGPQD